MARKYHSRKLSHTRKLQNFIEGACYGCWITPNGTRVLVEAPGKHREVLTRHLRDTKSGISFDDAIMSKGYVSVWAHRTDLDLIYTLGGCPLTFSQKKELFRVRDEWGMLLVKDDKHFRILESEDKTD